MRKNYTYLFSFFLTLCFSLHSEIEKEKIKSIIEKNKNAVVNVKIIMKQWMVLGGQETPKEEVKYDITGTFISPEGILIASSFASDIITKTMENFNDNKFRFKSELMNVKIVLPNGKEIDGKIILKDEKLDFLFIKPISEEKSLFNAVDLKNTEDAEIGDDAIFLFRLAELWNRETVFFVSKISGIIEKPKKSYIMDIFLNNNYSISLLGCPVFSKNGKLLGITVMKTKKVTSPSTESLFFSPFGSLMSNYLPVIIPAKEIEEVLNQGIK
ncbi:MAG: serine protease [Candidatus Omnitrophica bacterium]|nr:serine protease [Candidatus Omnitrophota bacterium]